MNDKKLYIENKLQILREEWRKAKKSDRQIIELRARALKNALAKIDGII